MGGLQFIPGAYTPVRWAEGVPCCQYPLCLAVGEEERKVVWVWSTSGFTRDGSYYWKEVISTRC